MLDASVDMDAEDAALLKREPSKGDPLFAVQPLEFGESGLEIRFELALPLLLLLWMLRWEAKLGSNECCDPLPDPLKVAMLLLESEDAKEAGTPEETWIEGNSQLIDAAATALDSCWNSCDCSARFICSEDDAKDSEKVFDDAGI